MKLFLRACLVFVGCTFGFSSAAPEPRVLHLRASYSWAGLALEWPGYDYVFDCAANSDCRVSGVHSKQARSQRKTTCRFDAVAIKSEALQALWRASVRQLVAVNEPVSVITHTDDYPRFDLTLTTVNGVTALLNTSNGGNRPWNVGRNGRWYVQRTGELERAYANLIRPLPCETQR